MKIRFERNRRSVFIETQSLFLNFLDLNLPDTSAALLNLKMRIEDSYVLFWNWILRSSYSSNLQKKKKIAEVTIDATSSGWQLSSMVMILYRTSLQFGA